ncbi:MAG: GNAT family N-acetyltransferase [Caldilineaceae bacterium]
MRIQQLTEHDLTRSHAIDVSERGHVIYRYVDGVLQTTAAQWARPQWTQDEWQQRLQHWIADLHPDLFLGAFVDERLVGLASLRYRLTETMAQLTTLHISRTYRRQGVATALTQAVIRLVKAQGAQTLYVSATESASAVNFYLSQGFRPTAEPHPALFALEPNDIHMDMQL